MKKQTRKILAVILLLVVLLSSITLTSSAASSEYFTFDKSEYSTNVGGSVTVSLKAKKTMDLSVLDFEISYDKTHVKPTSYVAGAKLAAAAVMGNPNEGAYAENPIITLSFASATQLSVAANEEIAKITFEVIGEGSANINTNINYARKMDQNDEVLVDYAGGTIGATIKGVVEVSGVSLSATKGSLNVGETTTLTATVNPENATDKNVTWKSDKTNVATVSGNGNTATITAKGKGTATITATVGGKTATYTLTVNVPLTGISMPATITVPKGRTVTLTVSKVPADATEEIGTVEWSIPDGDKEVVTVKNGVVTGLKAGTATVTAKVGNFTKTCVVTVKEYPLVDIDINSENFELAINDTKQLGIIYKSEDPNVEATDGITETEWKTSNETIATVENGLVKGLKAGKVTVTAKVGEFEKSVEVTVTEKKVEEKPGVDNVDTTVKGDSNSPKTGDIAIGAAIVLLLVSTLGIAFVIKKNRK